MEESNSQMNSGVESEDKRVPKGIEEGTSSIFGRKRDGPDHRIMFRMVVFKKTELMGISVSIKGKEFLKGVKGMDSIEMKLFINHDSRMMEKEVKLVFLGWVDRALEETLIAEMVTVEWFGKRSYTLRNGRKNGKKSQLGIEASMEHN